MTKAQKLNFIEAIKISFRKNGGTFFTIINYIQCNNYINTICTNISMKFQLWRKEKEVARYMSISFNVHVSERSETLWDIIFQPVSKILFQDSVSNSQQNYACNIQSIISRKDQSITHNISREEHSHVGELSKRNHINSRRF